METKKGILEVSNLWSSEKALGYQTYDFGSFVQVLDGEELERLLRLHLRFVSISFELSLIYAWHIPL
jgi:hypothetical protein